MDIIVKGEGKKLFSPDFIEISIFFENNANSYDLALEKGIKSVNEFNEYILNELGISKDTLKTTRFTVRKNLKYNYQTKEYDDHGYDFTQNSSLSFDFDIKLVSNFIEKVSKLELPPKYTLNFTLKDTSIAKKEVLGEAFKNAEQQANIIANAANKELKECLKIDFRPFTDTIISDSHLSNDFFEERSMKMCQERSFGAISETIEENFNPEDIEVVETLYCLWKAE